MDNLAAHESALNPKPQNHHTYSFDSPHPIYAMAFSTSSPSPCLALGSFIEEINNRVDIVSFDEETLTFRSDPQLSFEHQYPPTKLMFHPKPLPGQPHSLLASSGEFLRLWRVKESATELCSVFNTSKSTEFCSPLTSFDWNQTEPRRIGTSSIDTTCTVWDIERCAVETQLIAHDKEVYDIAWGGAAVFASVSADGSVRIFDLRDKEHSAIVYECPRPDTPLLRLAWNKMDVRYMATILMDSNQVVVIDIRSPALPVAELQRHGASVNAIGWAPQTARHLCSAGDDGQVFIWETPTAVPPEGVDPLLAYQAAAEINQMQWSAAHRDWIGVAFSNKVQLLRV